VLGGGDLFGLQGLDQPPEAHEAADGLVGTLEPARIQHALERAVSARRAPRGAVHP
jgi:hypothetical protein